MVTTRLHHEAELIFYLSLHFALRRRSFRALQASDAFTCTHPAPDPAAVLRVRLPEKRSRGTALRRFDASCEAAHQGV